MHTAAYLGFLVFLCAWSPVAKAHDPCSTTEVCEAPGARSCTAAARSAGPLNFYWRIGLQPKHRYVCEMDAVHHVSVLPDACTVPEGVARTWDACCTFTPAVVIFDTHAMQDAEGDAIIKFQVAPSDIPSDVRVACRFDDDEA